MCVFLVRNYLLPANAMRNYQKSIRQLFYLYFLLCFQTFPCFANKEAPVSAADVEALKQQFENLQKTKEILSANIDKEEKGNQFKAEDITRLRNSMNLTCLYELMSIERDLTILVKPIEPILEKVDILGLNLRDNKRIYELQLEIRQAECTRIRQGIVAGQANYEGDRFHEKLLKKELSLLQFYQRATKKGQREILKIEKELAKEKKSRIIDRELVKELKEQRDELITQNKKIATLVFGYTLGAGFEYEYISPNQSIADLQALLKKERERVVQFLRTEQTNRGEGEERGGSIGGTFIYSENLGVVLDISGSMTPFIESLKYEIAQSFQSPHYRETFNCVLQNIPCPPRLDLNKLQYGDTMISFAELLIINQVDTLYWFSDLRDGQSPAALRRLLDMVLRSGAALNVRSVGDRPSRAFKPMITNFTK